jgi:moderate conductance mechanosensitive channel
MFTGQVVLKEIIIAIAIILVFFGFAWVFYFLLRRWLSHLSKKTKTVLDDLMIKAIEWPIFAAIILSGLYLSSAYLPIETQYDFQISRGFHLVFILLGAWTIIAAIDALFRWFKMEVTSKTNTPVDDWITLFIRIVSPIIVTILTVLASLELYSIDASGLKTWLLTYGVRIGVLLVISIVALFLMGVIGSRAITAIIARRPAGQSEEEVKKRANTISSVLLATGQVLIIAVTALIILSEFVDITPALAGAGVVGIAVGLGAQSLFKDLIAGFFIIMENQYRVGDVVSIAGISGLVEDINLRRTVLRDLDGIVHTVPNGEIKTASNYTKEYSSVNLNISVSYGTDLDKAIEVANRVCKELAEDPQWSALIINAPSVLRVDNLGDSGIDLKITGNTKPVQQWAVTGELRKRLKKAFDQAGIEIPWPHTMVYFGNSPDKPLHPAKSDQYLQ